MNLQYQSAGTPKISFKIPDITVSRPGIESILGHFAKERLVTKTSIDSMP
jgi:hypothetical protein